MRIGIDTYSYHRLLGMPRPGEEPAAHTLANSVTAPVEHARELGCDVVALQTCFLGPPAALDAGRLLEAAGELEIVLSWGHPEGLAFGRDPDAEPALHAWLDRAPALNTRLVRIVVGGPALRGSEPAADQIARTVAPLRRAAERAADRGLELAVENHGDITSTELLTLLDAAPGVGACFDSANAVRVGEDPLVAAARLAGRVRIVHLKDVEAPERATDPVAGPCSVPFGTGVVPLRPILAALEQPVAAGAPVCVELGQIAPGTDERALLAESIAWLRA